MKIGIIQGRLSSEENGFQETPSNWRREFELLEELKLNHIEWVITKKSFLDNPLFKEDTFDLPISSLCADHIVDAKIVNKSFLFDSLVPLCEYALKNKIPSITIPLLEDSDVKDNKHRADFNKNFSELIKIYDKLNFSIEAELPPHKLMEIINAGDNVSVTYDTGNITSSNLDHEEYITHLLPKINNIHLKDRTYNAKTVQPGTGDTNFDVIFNVLSKMKYNGVFTLQTARGPNGREIETIKEHKKMFEEIYNEYN
tara:strand:- start:481 stop:1248 length:768 start_codon:yes stop_codon:yes gene_type:complete